MLRYRRDVRPSLSFFMPPPPPTYRTIYLVGMSRNNMNLFTLDLVMEVPRQYLSFEFIFEGLPSTSIRGIWIAFADGVVMCVCVSACRLLGVVDPVCQWVLNLILQPTFREQLDARVVQQEVVSRTDTRLWLNQAVKTSYATGRSRANSDGFVLLNSRNHHKADRLDVTVRQ